MRSHSIAVIPGDGIGVEVIDAALDVLNAVQKHESDFKLDFHHYDYGSALYRATGRYAPADFLTQLKSHDAILFGAVGAPDVPDHISLWELLLPMRQALAQYVNLRPVRSLPNVAAPVAAAADGRLDWVIVRENTEGEYAGQGGRTHQDTLTEVATEVAIFTRAGCERLLRFAFEQASKRPKKLLTVVTKSNAQRNGLVLWDEVAEFVSKDFPHVKWDKMLVDAMTIRMIRKPESLDVIACTNLHGDILSDLAAGLSGSIGIAPSCNLDPSRKLPSMFEPVHGAAFDITGKNLANPVAAIWSAVHMLRWLGEHTAADRVETAMLKAIQDGEKAGDIGGSLGTDQVTKAIIDRL